MNDFAYLFMYKYYQLLLNIRVDKYNPFHKMNKIPYVYLMEQRHERLI